MKSLEIVIDRSLTLRFDLFERPGRFPIVSGEVIAQSTYVDKYGEEVAEKSTFDFSLTPKDQLALRELISSIPEIRSIYESNENIETDRNALPKQISQMSS